VVKTLKVAAALLLVILCGLGCGGGPRYFRLPLDLGRIQRVAVLPIENLTREPAAGEKLRHIIMAELLARGSLQVAEPGAVDRTLRQLRAANRFQPSPEEVQQLGEALDVQAVISGAVSEFTLTRAGGNIEAPEVAVQLFMTDVATGSVVWAATESESGLSFWVRHFGAEPLRISEQASRTVRSVVGTLFAAPTREPFPQDERFEQERKRRQALAEAMGAREKRMAAVEEMLSASLGQQVGQRVAEVRRSENAVRLLCSLDVFFDYGQVELSAEGQLVAERVAGIIRERAANQTVEVIIYPEEGELSEEVQRRYGSAWEMSAARAASLLTRLERHGLDPSRLKASYFGAKKSGLAPAERVEITVMFPLAEERQPPEAVDLSGGV
jgi:flagellar motor protein MotB